MKQDNGVVSGGRFATQGARRATAKPRHGTASGGDRPPVSADDRQRMIAEAAYYRALVRGFAPGREADDWFEAEVEIDRVLRGAVDARPADPRKGSA